MALAAHDKDPNEVADRVADLVKRDGLMNASRTLGLAREQVARIVARIPVRKNTLAIAAMRLPSTHPSNPPPRAA